MTLEDPANPSTVVVGGSVTPAFHDPSPGRAFSACTAAALGHPPSAVAADAGGGAPTDAVAGVDCWLVGAGGGDPDVHATSSDTPTSEATPISHRPPPPTHPAPPAVVRSHVDILPLGRTGREGFVYEPLTQPLTVVVGAGYGGSRHHRGLAPRVGESEAGVPGCAFGER